jgi:hypothetical protein
MGYRLIQDWDKEELNKLIEFIKDKIDVKPINICAVGSRVFGGFHEGSDFGS